MAYLILFIVLFFWFGFWSAQAGRTISYVNEKLDDWQDKNKLYEKVPEIIIGSTIGLIGVWGWDKLFNLEPSMFIVMFVLGSLIAYGGKESATWAYLNWEGHEGTPRNSTLRKINDIIAGWFGFKLGDEGYSWVWASTKGFITTLPIGFLGAIFLPVGKEIASHAKERLPLHYSFWQEFAGDGFAYSASATLFIILIGV